MRSLSLRFFPGPLVPTLVSLMALTACGVTSWRPTLLEPEAVPPAPTETGRATWLKVHMANGDLYVLDSWTPPQDSAPLTGHGILYGPDRFIAERGSFELPRDDIALLETNRRETVSRFAYSGLVVYSTLWGTVTLACLADPKSCFGSCPTFYGEDPDRPLAEGFSASFARALEAPDVDMLGLRRPPGVVSLTMRNEALETHAVRRVQLLGVNPRGAHTVLKGPNGGFFGTLTLHGPTECDASGTDCRISVTAFDDIEYAPSTDPADLAAREEVLLSFEHVPDGDVGVAIGARQSLVTTYVFYQSLAYAGTRMGDLLAALERGTPGIQERVLGPARILGGIEVFVRRHGGDWQYLGDFAEAGPIASDRVVFPLRGSAPGPLEVRLRMARGSWRLDWVALAELTDELDAVILPLDSVSVKDNDAGEAHRRLTDPTEHLVTTPGDEHRLWFTLPDGPPLELFLDTKGFYYEWMRGHWLREEDHEASALLLTDPARALKSLAPSFKAREATMEDLFWASRFRRR